MKIINFFVVLVLLSICTPTWAKDKPNIIYILCDDLGYGDVSCLNSNSKVQTPNIDKMSQQGMTFVDAHSSSSVCTPSRYGIMTGRYCWRGELKKGVLSGFSPALIEDGRETVASMLKSKGYNTACIGKWHLGMNWPTSDNQKPTKGGENVDFTKDITNTPTSHGFDYYYGICASLDMPPYLLIENTKVVEQPDVVYNGRGAKVNPSPFGRPGPGCKSFKPESALPALTEKVTSVISDYSSKDEPYFIYLPLPAPHTPVAPNEEFKGMSKAGDYGDFVVEVDNVLKNVLAAVEKSGEADNTLIIFTSDNGPEVHAYARAKEYNHSSQGDLRGLKRDLWEGGHRVPFFVKWPNSVKAKTVCERTICLSDFMATVADIVDVDMDDNTAEDSYSMYPLMKKASKKSKRPYTIHHSARGNFAIRKGYWVFIDNNTGSDNKAGLTFYSDDASKGDTKGQLFNLSDDYKETKNLYNEVPEKVKELKDILEECKL